MILLLRIGETRAALRGLPVEALRLEAKTVTLLKHLGLRRIGQLYDLPRAALERRFSDYGKNFRKSAVRSQSRVSKRNAVMASQAVLWRLDQALGNMAEPRLAMNEPRQFLLRRDYPELLISSEVLVNEIAALVDELCSSLAAANQALRQLRLSLYRAEGRMSDIKIGTSMLCRAPDHIMRLLSEKLDGIDAGFGIDLLTVEALQVEKLEEKQTGFSDSVAENFSARSSGDEALHLLTDRLSNRLGSGRVLCLKTRVSHIPERAQFLAPLSSLSSFSFRADQAHRCAGAITGLADQPHGDGPIDALLAPFSACARPSLLLPVPEPISVLAALPDSPPARFTWRRISRRIVKAEGPERIAPEWWRDLPQYLICGQAQPEGDRQDGWQPHNDRQHDKARHDKGHNSEQNNGATFCVPHAVARDYYMIEDEHGGRYWVFRDGFYQYQRAAVSDRQANNDAARQAARSQTGEPSPGCASPRWYLHGLFG